MTAWVDRYKQQHGEPSNNLREFIPLFNAERNRRKAGGKGGTGNNDEQQRGKGGGKGGRAKQEEWGSSCSYII